MSAPAVRPNFCPNCGTKAQGDFCGGCGKRLYISVAVPVAGPRKSFLPKFLVWSGVAFLAFLLLVFVAATLSDEPAAESARAPQNSASPPVSLSEPGGRLLPRPERLPQAPSAARSDTPLRRGVPRPGETVTANPAYVPALCIESKKGFDEAIRWQNRRDFEELARVMLRHGGQLIDSGERLKVLDPGFMTTARVRILSTDRECYTIAEVTR